MADTLAPVSNGFYPGHFSGETGGTVEVPDFWLDAWQFVHIVDSLGRGLSVIFECLYVFYHACAGGDFI